MGEKFLEPTSSKPNALKGVGILGKHAALKASIAIGDDEQQELAIALSGLVRKGSRKKHKQFVEGSTNLIPQNLKLRGGVSWDTALTPANKNQERSWEHLFPLDNFPKENPTAFLSCTSCGKCVSSLGGNFHWGNLQAKCKCHNCNKAQPSFKWKCQCGVPWYTCAIHRFCCKQPSHTEATKRNQQVQTCPSSSKKLRPERQLKRTPSKEYEHLLGEDIDRARTKKAKISCLAKSTKRKANVVLGNRTPNAKRPTLLGPILSNRFKGLTTGSKSSCA